MKKTTIALTGLLFIKIICSCSEMEQDDSLNCDAKVEMLKEINDVLVKENDALMLRVGELETELSKTK